VQLSSFVAGSFLATKDPQTHSTVYDEQAVFRLALDWAHADPHSSSSSSTSTTQSSGSPSYTPFQVSNKPNPYYIPWMLHALLTDDRLREDPACGDLARELGRLQESFSSWTPTTKPLKELRWKMEPFALPSKDFTPAKL
jgi:hypothetical protein